MSLSKKNYGGLRMSRLKKYSRSTNISKPSNKILVVVAISLAALVVLGILLLFTDQFVGKGFGSGSQSIAQMGITQQGVQQALQPVAVTSTVDESNTASNDLWVWLEVPENLPSNIGDTFNVEVYIKPGATHNIGDLKLRLYPSGNVEFKGIGTKSPSSVNPSFHANVELDPQMEDDEDDEIAVNPPPGSITIGWDRLNIGLVDRRAPFHLASLQMKVKGSGSFQIFLDKTGSRVRYYDGTGGWSCPAPTPIPKISCGTTPITLKAGVTSQIGCGDVGTFYCTSAASTCSPVYPNQIGTEDLDNPASNLKSYTLKQGNTRIIRNTQCIPNPDACSGKCGKANDGCGKVVNCPSCGTGKTCSNNVCVEVGTPGLVLNAEDKALCEAVIATDADARDALEGVSNALQGKNLEGQALDGCPGEECKYFKINTILNALTTWFAEQE
ncbi:hypothetical protein HYU08_03675 [Candidatus Woesearchaeota archaeon]|nr:hypothetical protein [Candidatus Woesearchaeota archaeon]